MDHFNCKEKFEKKFSATAGPQKRSWLQQFLNVFEMIIIAAEGGGGLEGAS